MKKEEKEKQEKKKGEKKGSNYPLDNADPEVNRAVTFVCVKLEEIQATH